MTNQVVEIPEKELQLPLIRPEAINALSELCENVLLAWIIDAPDVPQQMRDLFQCLGFLNFYEREVVRNSGMVEFWINQASSEIIVKTVNALAQENRIYA